MSANRNRGNGKVGNRLRKYALAGLLTALVACTAASPFEETSSAALHAYTPAAMTSAAERNSVGDEAVLENEAVRVSVSAENLKLEILNKHTGYVWKHTAQAGDGLNDTWRTFAESGVTVTVSVKETNTRQISYAGTADLYTTGDGLEADISLGDTGISFTVRFTLETDGLTVSIPFVSLRETSDACKLQSVMLYPFLGASYGLTEGFILIPDGPGALIDLSAATNARQPYSAPVYGDDIGFSGVSVLQKSAGTRQPDRIPAPVYGIGYEGNALMSYLSSGAEQAVINAYSSSIVTPYNWTSASFVYRDFYYQYASAAQDISSGVLLNQVLPNAINPAVRFVLLGGEDAGYTGMAARFKSILMDDGILTPIGDGRTAGDLHASILVADNRKALIGRNVVKMTEAGQALDMIQRLRELAPGGIRVELDGYQKGGLTTQPPKLGRLMGGDGAWKTVFESFDSLNARLYLKRDYYRVYGGATGYSRFEIALNSSEQLAGMHNEKNISRGSISSKEYMYFRFLHPEAVGRLLEDDQKRLDDLGVDGLSFDTVGQILNSVYGENALSRTEAAAAYRSQLLSTDRDIALHDPSLYLWLCSQVFFDMPTDQTGYVIASHPVPFFPLVLSGCAELYASYANFQADMEGYLLRVLEYGLRPSYLLTWEDASRLMRTDSRWICSSQWDVWKTRIEEHMAFLEEGFNAVRGAELVGHHSLGKELFVSIYSNGTAVYVNYGDRAAEADGIIIPPRGYTVREEGGDR